MSKRRDLLIKKYAWQVDATESGAGTGTTETDSSSVELVGGKSSVAPEVMVPPPVGMLGRGEAVPQVTGIACQETRVAHGMVTMCATLQVLVL